MSNIDRVDRDALQTNTGMTTYIDTVSECHSNRQFLVYRDTKFDPKTVEADCHCKQCCYKLADLSESLEIAVQFRDAVTSTTQIQLPNILEDRKSDPSL